ncbi:substrate-binding periplasmic protein [Pelagibacterium lacus]|uniref:Uncharacterized protein n=1 Tax=Pelagibacterium lacus TaxID=2282655 RepID=A0A369W5Y5_9HYPH|nr:transporter substrate-binding domain-containing protein [Pelagibacterium lacus]RDE10066.1 hypothetical protein DVH29_03820 [Pelagibacterium lacus]
MRRLAPALVLGLTLACGAMPAQGQMLPPQLLDSTRPTQGDSIRACVDDDSPGGPLDRAVAQAIGDALFLDVDFVPALRGFPLDGDGYLAEMEIHLNNDCDLFMGIAVQPNSPFPEWAAMTRPYAQVPFVLVVADPDYRSLGDIPLGSTIGTAVASLGERVFITSMLQRPREERWRRLPYADFDLMTTRLLDGSLEGMLLWQPAWVRIAEQNAAASHLRIIPLDPVPQAVVQVGALISSYDTFLRTEVDAAIGALAADGTLDAILGDLGLD